MGPDLSGIKVERLSPILAVPDIKAAIDYYTRVLGFQQDFVYGEPPVHGAVRWGNIQIQLGLNPELAARAAGTQYFLFVDAVNDLHAIHTKAGAEIVSPIATKPWGLREYTVRDPWGHELRFAGQEKFTRPPNARDSLPAHIQIIERLPTVEEFVAIVKSVNWTCDPDAAPAALQGTLYGIVAVDQSDSAAPKAVGMLRMFGDGVTGFFIQDVAVMPSHQNQHIGAAMIETAIAWVQRTAAKGAFVGLFTMKPAFYERLGFITGVGMHLKT